MDQSAQAISTFDVVWLGRGRESQCWSLRVGRRQVERAVRPVAVVMVDEDAQHPLEMAAVED